MKTLNNYINEVLVKQNIKSNDGIASDTIGEKILNQDYTFFDKISIDNINLKYWQENNWK